MKKISLTVVGLASLFLMSCGGDAPKESTGKAPVSMVEQENTGTEKKVEEKSVGLPASTAHAAGLEVYNTTCKACHQASGQGMAGVFPPLAKSDYIADKEATIKQVLHGSTGEMIVNGETYNGTMTPFNNLSDEQISDVLNFVYNSWGNTPLEVTPAEVAALR